MSQEHKKVCEPEQVYGVSEEMKRKDIVKSRAKTEEVMEATKRGIDRYRDTLKNLAKR